MVLSAGCHDRSALYVLFFMMHQAVGERQMKPAVK